MQVKQRHGCLTAWLILMIVANALVGLIYLFGSSAVSSFSNVPEWALVALGFISFVNVAAAVTLFMWKKWGFYLFIGTSIIIFIINLIAGANLISAILGFIGIAFLYGVLQIGKENKGWPQLD